MRINASALLRKIAIGLILSAPLTSNAQDYNANMPAPFEEPGGSATRSGDASFGVESIDPFTGGLKIVTTDLTVPMNGGLDLQVVRNYESFQKVAINFPEKGYQKGRTTTGAGWDLHFGRLWRGNGSAAPQLPVGTGCKQTNVTSRDNPILELPDGSRQMFAASDSSESNFAYISSSRWILRCLPNSPSTYPDGGAIVISPAGVKYYMTFLHRVSDVPISNQASQIGSNYAFHVTRIEHPNGTFITISYKPKSGTGATFYTLLDTVHHSEGEDITFQYDNPTSATAARLHSFTHASHTWTFSYSAVPTATAFDKLDYVLRPDGRKTQYEYVPRPSATGPIPDGVFSLNKATTTLGGVIEYTYVQKTFPGRDAGSALPQYVVSSKIVRRSGGSISGTWNYNYVPATSISPTGYDMTYVNGPTGCESYKHESVPVSGSKWRIGLLIEKGVYAPTSSNTCGSSLLRRETNTWVGMVVATQDYFRPPGYSDSDSYAPRLSVRVIRLDGTDYTTNFNSPDSFGNPQTVVENGQTPNESGGSDPLSRTSTYTYLNDTTTWIIGRLKNETIQNAGSTYASPTSSPITSNYAVTRTFYSGNKVGLVDTETRSGIATKYDYYTGSAQGGEVLTVEDANGIATTGTAGDYTTTFSNYKRGTARDMSRPIGGGVTRTISKEINDTGTIQWAKDGELKQTIFAYDEVNLVTGITTPRSDDANFSITRPSNSNNATITRGNLRQVIQYDGFGSVTRTDWTDTSTSANVFQKFDYDAGGRVEKRYFPGNSSDGVTVAYDALNRVKSETYPDGKKVAYEYLSEGRVEITDERLFVTRNFYRAFGDPAKTELILTRAPRGTANNDGLVQQTWIQRDLIGNVTSIKQGAMNGLGKIDSPTTRTYRYDPRFLVFDEINPETGTTRYGRDNVGNITAKTADATGAALTTSYSLDQLYRRDLVTFPGTTGTVDYDYYKNDLLKTVTRGNAVWDYTYDGNNNIETETLALNSPAFTPSRQYLYVHGYSPTDALKSITYPSQSGLKIDYSPDALGRPTRIDAYQNLVPIAPFATLTTFYANGQLNTITLGNNVTTTYTQDSRLRPYEFTSKATLNGAVNFYVNRVYGYDFSSNVTSIDDLTAENRDKSMSYDGLNRLRTANGPWGSGTINYHPNDNIDFMTFSGVGATPAYSVTMNYDAVTNRLTGVSGTIQRSTYAYDAYGNTTNNGEFGAGRFTFDDDSLLRAVNNNNDNQLKLAYTYDGNRRVVREYTASTNSNRYRATAQNGLLFFEEDIENSFSRDHVYLGSRLIATRMRCTSGADTDGDGVTDCVEAKFGMSRTVNDADSDADADGVSNKVEIQSASDIYKIDTDGDGLSDNYEIKNGLAAYLADSNADSDGDGLSNIAEYQLGTKPNDSDSDDDGLPDNSDPAPMFNPAWLIPVYQLLLEG